MCYPDDVVRQRPRPRCRHRKEQRRRQIERYRRHNPRQPQRNRQDEIPPIVVIEIASAEPRVIGRHCRRPRHRRKVGQLHRLFAPSPGVPQIGVGGPHQQEAHIGQQKQQLRRRCQPPFPPQPLPQLRPLPPQHDGRGQRHGRHRQPDGGQRVAHRPGADQQPGHQGHQQQPAGPRRQQPPVRQRTQQPP